MYNRIEEKMSDNRKGFGPRENYSRVVEYLNRDKKEKLEKFYLVIDEDDKRFGDLEPPFKMYEDKPAMQHLRHVDKHQWMAKRKMVGAQ